MDGGPVHIRFGDIEAIYRNEIVEMTADYEGMFTNMNSIQAANAPGGSSAMPLHRRTPPGPRAAD